MAAEWLRSVGGRELWKDSKLICLTKPIEYDCHEMGFGTENCIGWQFVNTWQGEEEAVDIGEIKTRHDVRHLCESLNIPLPAPASEGKGVEGG